jgi:hypothetical protein
VPAIVNIRVDFRRIFVLLSPEDGPMVQNILRPSREIMTSWIERNYESLKVELKDLSDYNYGERFEITFYKIWYELFGAANRILKVVGKPVVAILFLIPENISFLFVP